MKRTLLAAAACLMLVPGAMAASITLPFVVSPTVVTPPSTGITCTAVSTTLVAPVAPGTVLSTCTVAPATWNGAVTVGDGNVVAIMTATNVFQVKVGAIALVAGSYSEVLTAAP